MGLSGEKGGQTLYRIGETYKIETNKGIFYTAEVIEQEAFSIKILDRDRKEIILNRSEIARAKRIGEDNEQIRKDH